MANSHEGLLLSDRSEAGLIDVIVRDGEALERVLQQLKQSPNPVRLCCCLVLSHFVLSVASDVNGMPSSR